MMIVMVMVVAYKWEDVYEDEHIMWYVQENVRLQVPEQ